jgi:hypothetical protein
MGGVDTSAQAAVFEAESMMSTAGLEAAYASVANRLGPFSTGVREDPATAPPPGAGVTIALDRFRCDTRSGRWHSSSTRGSPRGIFMRVVCRRRE